MPARTTATAHTTPVLIRTKTGTANDTVYADGITTPADADTATFSAYTPSNSGKGHASELELHVVAVTAARTAIARGTCTFDIQVTHIIERQFTADPGVTAADFASQVTTLTGQSLQTPIRVPFNGGKVFVGFQNFANVPGGTISIEVWGKPVAG